MAILHHYSEESGIERFVPRLAPANPNIGEVVWALHPDFAPIYFFPRDCPRVCYWNLPETTQADREKFLGHTSAQFVLAIESAWLERMRSTTIYRYHLPEESFEKHDPETFYGAYVSRETVVPVEVEPIPDLLSAITNSDCELRVTPSLWPLWDEVIQSTVHFSGIRLRNALPRLDTKVL